MFVLYMKLRRHRHGVCLSDEEKMKEKTKIHEEEEEEARFWENKSVYDDAHLAVISRWRGVQM